MRAQKLLVPLLFSAGLSLSALLLLGGSVAQVMPEARPSRAAQSALTGEHMKEAARPRRRPTPSKKPRILPLKSAPVSPWNAQLLAPAAPASLLPIVDQTAIHSQQRMLADRTLRTLPASCRDHLQTFIVRYDHPDRRGLGGKTTIIVDGSVPDSEFVALITHECGHVIHGNLTGNARSGDSAFRDGNDVFFADGAAVSFFALSWENERTLRAGQTDKDFVSGYAKSDAFEDFAETFAAFLLHRHALEQQAAQSATVAAKLAWMRSQFGDAPMLGMESQYNWNGSVPWDVTKLPLSIVS